MKATVLVNGRWGKVRTSYRKCKGCGSLFPPTSVRQVYCDRSCRSSFFGGTTKEQYSRISGKWPAYFNRLRHLAGSRHRHKFVNRSQLTVAFLLSLLEKQKGVCALSGERLTCELKQGVRYRTNASVDRIDSNKGYSSDNVRLVCTVVNVMRQDLDDASFRLWCKACVTKAGLARSSL